MGEVAALLMRGNHWGSHETGREISKCLEAQICKKSYQNLPWYPQGVATVLLEPVNSSHTLFLLCHQLIDLPISSAECKYPPVNHSITLSAPPAWNGDLRASMEGSGPPGGSAVCMVGRVGPSGLHPLVYTPDPQRHGLVPKEGSG